MKNFAPGLLIAMPSLRDPNFERSVVLVLEHSDEGTMGLVVNKASPLTLKELAKMQDIPLADVRGSEPVFAGGPVGQHRGFVLHNSDELSDKIQIVPGLYLSVTQESLGPLLNNSFAWVRFCLGYAGWGPGQLQKELTEGSWLTADVSLADLIEEPAERMWDCSLSRMGVNPAYLVSGGGIH